MSLTPGTRLGPYEITGPIGAGGMGEVYRATDTNLKRTVAIKVLPEAVATDRERLARFQREAEVLARLNHPNIAAIYGLEKSDGTVALVMELVEGPTLADRLARGPLPLDEALAIARQVAEALEAAHEQGIIHRDLKPANIKVREDGTVKVLDFGLAKALDPVGITAGDLANSPTITSPAMTEIGMILGTAAYMSPEQARGKPVDRRADIWAFGAVVFELLTGKRAFPGEDITDTLAAVVRAEPDWNLLPRDLSPTLLVYLRRCLQKDPKQRPQAMGDVRLALEGAFETAAPAAASPAAAPPRPFWRRAIPVALAAVLASALTFGAAWSLRPLPPPLAVTRSVFPLPEGQTFTNTGRNTVAISPDGARMVYVANSRLYLRSLSDVDAKPITGTESFPNVINPVFSPDGQSVAFFTITRQHDQANRRHGRSGGDDLAGDHSVWHELGARRHRVRSGRRGILRVSPARHTAGARQGERGRDGRESAGAPWGRACAVHAGDRNGRPIDGSRQKSSCSHSRPASDASSSRAGATAVIFRRGMSCTRWADRSSPSGSMPGGWKRGAEAPRRSSRASGERALQGIIERAQHISACPTPDRWCSSLARPRSSQGCWNVARIDRKGGVEPLNLPAGQYQHPRVSPDGSRLAVVTNDPKGDYISIYDLAGGTGLRRLTFGGNNRFPIWSRDSQRVTFQSDRDGDQAIFWQLADGTGRRSG